MSNKPIPISCLYVIAMVSNRCVTFEVMCFVGFHTYNATITKSDVTESLNVFSYDGGTGSCVLREGKVDVKISKSCKE